MLRTLLFATLAFAASNVVAQSPQLSEQAQISIITCGPYQGEVYSAFGHTAIRVFDPQYQYDVVYNYGVFDFDQPNFYLNFARGYSLYKLGVMPYPWFRDVYISYNRYVHEQILNLTQAQKQKLFDFLEWNAKPENMNYLYDYFYDNCATRARDVFVNVLKEDVKFDTTYITTNYTIRQLTDFYLGQQPWGDLGIDICLGLPMDKKASPYEYMFLPDYIESSFDHASIRNDSTNVALVQRKVLVYQSHPEEIKTSLLHPWYVFGLLLLMVVAISVLDWRRGNYTRGLDVTLFGVTGLVGWLLLFLWFGTNHKAAAFNFNLLWAMPTHALGAWLIARNKRTKLIQQYFTFALLLTGILLGTWYVLPQQMNSFLLPFVCALFVRSLVISQMLRKQVAKKL
jgi:hypothetical protein